MAKLYSVRIEEVEYATSNVQTIGQKHPLRTLEEVREFLLEYCTTWKQLAPPSAEVIEAQFEAQREVLDAAHGPALPGSRRCLFTLYPYAEPDIDGRPIEHIISILEMSGKLSSLGEKAMVVVMPATRIDEIGP